MMETTGVLRRTQKRCAANSKKWLRRKESMSIRFFAALFGLLTAGAWKDEESSRSTRTTNNNGTQFQSMSQKFMNWRPKPGNTDIFSQWITTKFWKEDPRKGDRKARSKAYSTNRTKPRRKR